MRAFFFSILSIVLFSYTCVGQSKTSKNVIKSLNSAANTLYGVSQNHYSKIYIASVEYGARALEYKEKSDKLKAWSDELCEKAQRTDFETGFTIFLEEIESYQKKCLKLIETEQDAPQHLKAITAKLSNEIRLNLDVTKYTNEKAALLPALIQLNVRNIENLVVSYLYSNISSPSFLVNKIEPVVLLPKVIGKGDEAKAEVYLAGFDTTKNLEAEIGDEYYIGEDGKLKLKLKTNKTGANKVNGKLIIRTMPFFETKEFPLSFDYYVAQEGVPTVRFGARNNWPIQKIQLLVSRGIRIEPYSLNYKVISYEITITNNEGIQETFKSNSARFNWRAKAHIGKAKLGSRVIIDKVYCEDIDGNVKQINGIVLRLY